MDLLLSSSPVRYIPSTPISNRRKSYNDHAPLNSSPLTQGSGSPFSSPVAEAQARRQSQYKSRAPSRSSRPRNSPSRTTANSSALASNSQQAILKDRLKSRCVERAQKARRQAYVSKRRSDPSHIFDDAMDDDEGDDAIESELFARVVRHQAREERQEYRRSYYADMGTSFDPDLEDITAWEDELQTVMEEHSQVLTPEDIEQAELEAYAKECERQAALADFEGIPIEELFEMDSELEEQEGSNGRGDVDMGMH
ncbi:hypothetical protein D9757_007097 [Collybiopsis confluens]|uniref:Uncharacterized protein n=1 Tax=Collybiopsis confluens TaxID=2823264 RepID=A0A8H5M4M0_9AGAR|nr:hypothetical protein D9757_007097 [Collybiopsis confluens]